MTTITVKNTMISGLMYREGKLAHKEDGPLYILDGIERYWLNGVKFSKASYTRLIFSKLSKKQIRFYLSNIDFMPTGRKLLLEEFCMNDPDLKLMYLKAKL